MLNHSLCLRDGRLIDLSSPKVMGILNVTPDSFYDGGRYEEEGRLIEQALAMLEQGASILDVGGYSTRPGADDISVEEEKRRVVGAVRAILKAYPDAVISVDTFRAEVAKAGVGEGALLINDISGGQLDQGMFDAVAELKVPYFLMHTRGTPQTMKGLTDYSNLIEDLLDYFQGRIMKLRALGVKDVIVDPGFGFAKTLDQNYELLSNLSEFHMLGCPILAGISRKSMIYRFLGISAYEALNGTTALHMLALQQGVQLLRVHDAKEAIEAVALWEKYKGFLPKNQQL